MTKPIMASLLVGLLIACRSGGPARDTAAPVHTVIDTIAGVEHIQNSGVPPTWRLEQRLTLGAAGSVGEPAPDEFGRVTSAIWGPGDRVYVADAMNDEVKVFDLDGSLAFTFGRKGEGPGEFGALYSLAWIGDTLLALDFGVGRVSLFDAHGRWLGQRRHPGRITGSQALLRMYPTDRDEAYAWSVQATGRDRQRIFVRHTLQAAPDTLRQLPLPEDLSPIVVCEHPSGRSISYWEIPFAPSFLQHPARDRLIAAVRTDAYRIAFLNNEGDTVRVIERSLEPVAADAAEWDEGLQEYHEYRDDNPGASCEPSRLRMPEVRPPVRDMLLDPMGRLWIDAITPDGPYWEVFDSTGTLAGRVPVFPRGDRTVPYFADGYIVAVSADSTDVQFVTVYEFSG